MTAKRFEEQNLENHLNRIYDAKKGKVVFDEDIVDLLNALHEENEQLKQNKFICLDCEHSGYTEIGCLCEKKDHWTEYKTECEDYEELK